MSDTTVEISSTDYDSCILSDSERTRLGLSPTLRSAREANSYTAQVAAFVDACVSPLTFLVSRGEGEEVQFSAPKSSGLQVVGSTFDRLRDLDPNADGLSENERERRRYALALSRAVRTESPGAVFDLRSGGWLLGAVSSVITVVLAAVLVRYAVTSYVDWREREQRSQLARAGADYVERLRQYRQSGVMPPPSEVERSTAEVVRRSADSAWSEISRPIARGASKVGAIAALAAVGYLIFSKGKSNGGK